MKTIIFNKTAQVHFKIINIIFEVNYNNVSKNYNTVQNVLFIINSNFIAYLNLLYSFNDVYLFYKILFLSVLSRNNVIMYIIKFRH